MAQLPEINIAWYLLRGLTENWFNLLTSWQPSQWLGSDFTYNSSIVPTNA